jgi:hypothetical protein
MEKHLAGVWLGVYIMASERNGTVNTLPRQQYTCLRSVSNEGKWAINRCQNVFLRSLVFSVRAESVATCCTFVQSREDGAVLKVQFDS